MRWPPGPSSTIRVPLFAARTLKCHRSMPGHFIAAVSEIKSSLWATAGGKEPNIRPKTILAGHGVLPAACEAPPERSRGVGVAAGCVALPVLPAQGSSLARDARAHLRPSIRRGTLHATWLLAPRQSVRGEQTGGADGRLSRRKPRPGSLAERCSLCRCSQGTTSGHRPPRLCSPPRPCSTRSLARRASQSSSSRT